MLNPKEDIRFVLLPQVGAGHDLIGEGHTLPVTQDASYQALAADIAALDLLNHKFYHAVVHGDDVAGLQILIEPLIVDADFGFIPFHLVYGEGEGVPLVKFNFAILEGPDPVLRPLGVQHDGNGQIQLFPDALDQFNFLRMLLVSAVGKVQPGHVHARQAHLGEGFLVLTGRANGADDFGFPHTAASFFFSH